MHDEHPTAADPTPSRSHAEVGGLIIGETLGPYRVLDHLGEGGFAFVYRAEQREPVRREVAIKVLKPGMDSARIIARFEAERQTLAIMEHPSIAKVFDAGATPRGLPYFVMELVSGLPITRYADGKGLGVRQRLQLFVRVCEAIQHAHSKGIIHRDIKPSNVMVDDQHGEPLPKIIDFGIAKALTQHSTGGTALTEHGGFLGTPDYMPPEQAGAESYRVDARSDVYALGVLLYELLCGRRPYDLARVSHFEVVKTLGNTEPKRAHTRLMEGADARAIAQRRAARPEDLRRVLKRELDWIPYKAMQRDPQHRYRSAHELADEVQRYLRGEPLQAGPAGAGYRARKFLGRHRTPVAVGLSLAALLVVASAVSTTAYLRAERDKRNLADLCRQLSTRAVQMKDRRLLQHAEQILRDISSGQATALGQDHLDVLFTQNNLGTILKLRGDYTQSERLFRDTHQKALGTLGPDHPFSITVAQQLCEALLRQSDRATEARALAQDTRQRTAALGMRTYEIRSTVQLALAHRSLGELREAQSLLEQAAEHVGEQEPGVSLGWDLYGCEGILELASVRTQLGDPELGLDLLARALDRIAPVPHDQVPTSLTSRMLAVAQQVGSSTTLPPDEGVRQRAESVLRRASTLNEAVLAHAATGELP